jgi:hypothetical protein
MVWLVEVAEVGEVVNIAAGNKTTMTPMKASSNRIKAERVGLSPNNNQASKTAQAGIR